MVHHAGHRQGRGREAVTVRAVLQQPGHMQLGEYAMDRRAWQPGAEDNLVQSEQLTGSSKEFMISATRATIDVAASDALPFADRCKTRLQVDVDSTETISSCERRGQNDGHTGRATQSAPSI